MTGFIAHRGDPVHHRENTIPAFLAGEENGADFIELDVQMSKDGRCVILHDDTLDRLWNVDQAVGDLTYDEIRRLTAGDEYEIPVLEDVIRAVRVPMMIDVKYKESIDPIVDVLHRTHCVDRALIVGGNLDAHRRVRELLADVQTGLTWNQPVPPSIELLKDLRFHYFNPYWRLVTDVPPTNGVRDDGAAPLTLGSSFISKMHEEGLEVSVWTVDDEEAMWQLVEDGVNLIITNRSRHLIQSFKSRFPE